VRDSLCAVATTWLDDDDLPGQRLYVPGGEHAARCARSSQRHCGTGLDLAQRRLAPVDDIVHDRSISPLKAAMPFGLGGIDDLLDLDPPIGMSGRVARESEIMPAQAR